MNKQELAEQQKRRENIKAELKEMLKKAEYKVFTLCRHVSRSGMSRHIDVFIGNDNEPLNINWHIEQLGLYKRGKSFDSKNADSLRVSGCGMDMGFSLVYDLSNHLFKDEFWCLGEGLCHSNDHVNGDKQGYTKHLHSNAGYMLTQGWL